MTFVEAELPLQPPVVAPVGADDILDEALAILRLPESWTKYVFLARDNRGREVNSLSSKATAWTVIGALRLAAERLKADDHEMGGSFNRLWPRPLWDAYNKVEAVVPRGNVLAWQSHPFTTHPEVLAILRRARTRP